MRAYVSGEIRFNKTMDFDPIIGERFADSDYGMFVPYDEYFNDEVENLIKQINVFCKVNDAKADGYIEVTEDSDSINSHASYYWNNSKDCESYEGEYWLAHQCEDNVLIWELKRRGYEVRGVL